MIRAKAPDLVMIDVWLYGSLKDYGGESAEGSFANLHVQLADGCTLADLLSYLKMPTESRGITFINGQLSAMPGLQPDLGHILQKSDRVAFFDLRSMWPFQYRHGANMIEEMTEAMFGKEGDGLHTTYKG